MAQSPAGVAPPLFLVSPDGRSISVRPTPILFYPTTAFVGLSPTLVDNATAVRVTTLQSISCQSVLTSGMNSLYIGESDTLNPEVFEPPKSGSSLSNPTIKISAGTSVPINVNAVDITSITPTSGPARTTVSIDGVNFDADQTITVKVNGIIARQVDRLSDTQILFIVPSRTPILSPGPVEVTVGGVTKIGPDFTVTP